jgi:hypothetical protein
VDKYPKSPPDGKPVERSHEARPVPSLAPCAWLQRPDVCAELSDSATSKPVQNDRSPAPPRPVLRDAHMRARDREMRRRLKATLAKLEASR